MAGYLSKPIFPRIPLLPLKSTDGTDEDAIIAEFATKRPMADDIREVLIRDVLRKRKSPCVVPVLMAFCRSTGDTRAAITAIQACRLMATDKEK